MMVVKPQKFKTGDEFRVRTVIMKRSGNLKDQ
jgi:hypothetical protein